MRETLELVWHLSHIKFVLILVLAQNPEQWNLGFVRTKFEIGKLGVVLKIVGHFHCKKATMRNLPEQLGGSLTKNRDSFPS